MKKHVILFTGALLLAGCSAPAAAPAEAPSAAATQSAAASSAAPGDTPSAAPGSAPAAAPAGASGPRMTNEETCAELMAAFDASSLPDGDTDAGREAVAASLRTLPDRASEDLKDVLPAVTRVVTIMQNDAKNDTHELDAFLSDPAVSAEYDTAGELISTVCFPETTEEEILGDEAAEEEVVEEEVVEEEIVEEETVEPETAG